MYECNKIEMVHAEITGTCNARCSMCSRYTTDGNLVSGLVESHLDPELFYKFFNSDFLKNIKHVYFSGVYGDPCMHPNLIEFCQYLINHNVDVRVDTNGGYRNSNFWKNLAETGVSVNFAVDGLKDTNHLYRRNVSWEKVEANMRAFSQSGGNAQWNFIVFEHNEKDIEDARSFAKSLNFDFRIKITQKFNRFSTWHVIEDGKKLFELIPPTNQMYRHSHISKQPFSTNASYNNNFASAKYKQYDSIKIQCKSIDRKEIFLTFEGYVLPCCYLGTLYGKSPNVDQFKQFNLDNFSLRNYSVSDIVNNLSVIKETWDKTTAEGKLITCSNTCGKDQRQATKFIG